MRLEPRKRAVALSVTDAMNDDRLLGGAFAGTSWDRWKAVLKAALAEPMNDTEQALFRTVAERDPPTRRVKELWCIAGRRAGKDSIASAAATVAALHDYRAYLRPGERATVLCLAVDRDQAKIVHRYVKAHFKNPLLSPLVERDNQWGLELANQNEIIIGTNSFRATRGRTLACVILDEVAFWRSEESANPDREVYDAIVPGLVTLPGSLLIGITSPYRRSGLAFEKWRKSYATGDADILVVKGPSRTFNTQIPQRVIDAALERDPEAASAEWLGEWRNDLSDFIDRDVVESVVVQGRFELPPVAGLSYVGFVDPSGGSSDSMTVSVAHRDQSGRAVLDAVRERKPPFSPSIVVEEFAALLKGYGVSTITGDRYAGEWPREQFSKHGITYQPSVRVKNEIYRDALPLLNSKQVELLDNQRLVSQLCSLERRTWRGGKDTIDHPVGAHDDVANAAMGALVTCGGALSDAEMWASLGRDTSGLDLAMPWLRRFRSDLRK
jgi:hypothetical protein